MFLEIFSDRPFFVCKNQEAFLAAFQQQLWVCTNIICTYWNEGRKRGRLHMHERVDYCCKTMRSEKRKWFYVSLQNTSHTINVQERERQKSLSPDNTISLSDVSGQLVEGLDLQSLWGQLRANRTQQSDEAVGWLLKLNLLLLLFLIVEKMSSLWRKKWAGRVGWFLFQWGQGATLLFPFCIPQEKHSSIANFLQHWRSILHFQFDLCPFLPLFQEVCVCPPMTLSALPSQQLVNTAAITLHLKYFHHHQSQHCWVHTCTGRKQHWFIDGEIMKKLNKIKPSSSVCFALLISCNCSSTQFCFSNSKELGRTCAWRYCQRKDLHRTLFH